MSLGDVAQSMQKDSAVIEEWEAGSSAPTYVQLEALAYRIYRRPLALFFAPVPPSEADAKAELRLLPESIRDDLLPDTILALREAKSMRESLRILADGSNPAERMLTDEIDDAIDLSPVELASVVRDYLGISLQQQYSWTSIKESFKIWRAAIERVGIFVFKRPFKQTSISGFCLYDRTYPIIYVNNSASGSRQIFTLFHELAHLLFSASGMTIEDGDDLSSFSPENIGLETKCNKLAAEILLPMSAFQTEIRSRSVSEGDIESLARRFSVSREAVLRRFRDVGLVSQSEYREKAEEWNREYEISRRQASKGGDYYSNKRAYLSHKFVMFAYRNYYQGRCTLHELAEHLGMKSSTTAKFESYIEFEE